MTKFIVTTCSKRTLLDIDPYIDRHTQIQIYTDIDTHALGAEY